MDRPAASEERCRPPAAWIGGADVPAVKLLLVAELDLDVILRGQEG